MKTGDMVKHSSKTIQKLRDRWNGQGSYTAKNQARKYLDDALSARGTVIETGSTKYGEYIIVKMDGEEGTHQALPYMFEKVDG